MALKMCCWDSSVKWHLALFLLINSFSLLLFYFMEQLVAGISLYLLFSRWTISPTIKRNKKVRPCSHPSAWGAHCEASSAKLPHDHTGQPHHLHVAPWDEGMRHRRLRGWGEVWVRGGQSRSFFILARYAVTKNNTFKLPISLFHLYFL